MKYSNIVFFLAIPFLFFISWITVNLSKTQKQLTFKKLGVYTASVKQQVPPNHERVALIVRFFPKAQRKEEFKEALHELFEHLSQQPEFISATIHEDVDQPNSVVVYEVWRESKESFFNNQLSKPYFDHYEEKLEGIFDKPREIYWLTPYEELQTNF